MNKPIQIRIQENIERPMLVTLKLHRETLLYRYVSSSTQVWQNINNDLSISTTLMLH